MLPLWGLDEPPKIPVAREKSPPRRPPLLGGVALGFCDRSVPEGAALLSLFVAALLSLFAAALLSLFAAASHGIGVQPSCRPTVRL